MLTLLEVDRLRCLRAVTLELSPGITVLVGRNGQGKTSLLEAVYLLATGRSFRTTRLEEAVSRDGGPLRAAGRVAGIAGETRLAVVIDGGARRLAVDGVERGLDSFLGALDVVALTGERMRALRDGPDERRRFLDRGVAGLDPTYLKSLGEFRRVLEHRNALLRSGPGGRRFELDAWDAKLAESAARVHRRRREYAVRLGAALGEPARALLGEAETLEAGYRPSPRAAEEEAARRFEEVYLETLRKARPRDAAMGFTGDGPHRDDMRLELGGVGLREYGSAGQVRAAMIALKLGKLDLSREVRREAPVFLMDDFDADLDEERAGRVAAFLEGKAIQAILATSKEAIAAGLGVPFRKVRVVEGGTREA
jgi:DNA replication and repair protein RecF